MAAVQGIMKKQGLHKGIAAEVAEFGARPLKRDPKKYGIPSHEDIAADFRGLYKLSPLVAYGKCEYSKAVDIQFDLENWYDAEGKEEDFLRNLEARYLHHYREQCCHRHADANDGDRYGADSEGPNGEVRWMAFLTPYEREMLSICARVHLLVNNYAS